MAFRPILVDLYLLMLSSLVVHTMEVLTQYSTHLPELKTNNNDEETMELPSSTMRSMHICFTSLFCVWLLRNVEFTQSTTSKLSAENAVISCNKIDCFKIDQ